MFCNSFVIDSVKNDNFKKEEITWLEMSKNKHMNKWNLQSPAANQQQTTSLGQKYIFRVFNFLI